MASSGANFTGLSLGVTLSLRSHVPVRCHPTTSPRHSLWHFAVCIPERRSTRPSGVQTTLALSSDGSDCQEGSDPERFAGLRLHHIGLPELLTHHHLDGLVGQLGSTVPDLVHHERGRGHIGEVRIIVIRAPSPSVSISRIMPNETTSNPISKSTSHQTLADLICIALHGTLLGMSLRHIIPDHGVEAIKQPEIYKSSRGEPAHPASAPSWPLRRRQ